MVAVGGVDVKSAARPGNAPTRSVGVPTPACPPHTTNCFCGMGSCLRCTVMIVVVPASARRCQTRKARPGGRVSCGGRAAHRAIVAMCDTADSLTWCVLQRSCAGPPSSGRTAHGRTAQCTCRPPSAASRPHLRNRSEAISWPQSSTGTSSSCERIVRRSVRHKVATGVNRTTIVGGRILFFPAIALF